MKRLGLWFGLFLVIACEQKAPIESRSAPKPTVRPKAQTASGVTLSSNGNKPEDSVLVAPTTLLTLPLSAYGHVLAMDEETIFLMTRSALYRIPFGQPPVELPIHLGLGPALTPSNIIFWAQGAVQQIPKLGGQPKKLCPFPHEPQYFVTSGNHFAWLDQPETGSFSIFTLENGKSKEVYHSPGTIDAMTMLHDYVFFVERTTNGTYRFGGVSSHGGRPAFTAPRTGRTPAMLTVNKDIFFYDGNTRTIRSLSPDFQREETLVSDFICSPLSVTSRIFCGRVEGLFEVNVTTHTTKKLADAGRFTVTNLASNSKQVAWLSDIGQEKLALLSLPLDSDAKP